MYDSKDTQFVGKYDYDKEEALKYTGWGGKSFSVNIFPWVMKSNGKEIKAGKGVVRVSGSPLVKDKVFEMCENIVKQLDAVKWDGRKNVIVT